MDSEGERDPAGASDRAYAKGAGDAEKTAHLEQHDRHLAAINHSIDKNTEALDGVDRRLVAIERKELKRDAVAEATQKAAKAARTAAESHAAKTVSTRTFALGVIALIISLGGILVGIK